MSDFGRDSWERRWAQALDEHGEKMAQHPPNAHFLAEVADLPAGRALDAGAGHGAETLWLAERGWQVTAVDFSTTAVDHARGRAEAAGADVEFVVADLGEWAPPPAHYDLVVCIFVHVAGSVAEMVTRLASGVAPGGTLLLVGRPSAAGQVQVSVADAVTALDPGQWEVVVAEERGGLDAVIRARRAGAAEPR